MKKNIKILSLLLALTMLFSALTASAGMQNGETSDGAAETNAAAVTPETEEEPETDGALADGAAAEELPPLPQEPLTKAERQALLLETDSLIGLVGREKAVEAGYISRVRSEEKDLNTVVYETADGTYVMHVFGFPVKYTDKNGVTVDKSTKLTKSALNGKTVYGTESSDVKTYFGANLGEGVLLSYEDMAVQLLPELAVGSAQPGIIKDKELQKKPAAVFRNPHRYGRTDRGEAK